MNELVFVGEEAPSCATPSSAILTSTEQGQS